MYETTVCKYLIVLYDFLMLSKKEAMLYGAILVVAFFRKL
ncbi:hypothetical protein AALB_4002 [Agarivorans albus MKT 106]|uniref:Uncharacterized protein n=1 Tax=Agarivorans albus MKT 106 TaxID=1331007 RepID=R9PRA1_AGAAL|nr:hypothetical protein AALB_4002 [Agarivorans albus MKT 106]